MRQESASGMARRGEKESRGAGFAAESCRFNELVDLKALAQTLETFYRATGIPNGVVDVDGTVLTQAGWKDACTVFHRGHPQTAERCRESNLAIMRDLRKGRFSGVKCDNGLMDYATPVVIEGRQLATLFLGQVLHTPPDLAFFRKQAACLGFDEAQYLAAIQAIPVVAKERIEALMAFMVDMAQMLVDSGLARLRQSALNERNRMLEHNIGLIAQSEAASHERAIQLEDILDSSPVAVGWSHADGRVEYVNHRFTQIFGYTLDDLPDLQTWYLKAYPDPAYRDGVVNPWGDAVARARRNGTPPPVLEADVTCKDGCVRRVVIQVSWVGPRRLVNFTDISDRWSIEQRTLVHGKMLEMVARGRPLPEILDAIVRGVESDDKTALCSVLLLDDEGRHLLSGAAPSLPDFYNQAIHGVEIGMGVGSCGTAAYLGQRVVVEDIATHEYWTPYAPLAQKAGLGSCWSEPILSSQGKVLGTFAIYHAQPARPSQEDIERISFAANLASIAIENHWAHKELERRAYSDYLTGLANRRYFLERAEIELARARRYGKKLSILMFDIDHFKNINDAHGHQVGDRVLQRLSVTCQANLRDIDLIGRIGGEEFAVLLPESGVRHAAKTAERLRAALADTAIALDAGMPLKFTVSFGVAALKEKDATLNSLLEHADQALYQAKAKGRNQVRRYCGKV